MTLDEHVKLTNLIMSQGTVCYPDLHFHMGRLQLGNPLYSNNQEKKKCCHFTSHSIMALRFGAGGDSRYLFTVCHPCPMVF